MGVPYVPTVVDRPGLVVHRDRAISNAKNSLAAAAADHGPCSELPPTPNYRR